MYHSIYGDCPTLIGVSCSNTPPAPDSISDVCLAKAFLDDLNTQGQIVYSNSAFKAWDYYTNITEHNRQVMVSIVGGYMTEINHLAHKGNILYQEIRNSQEIILEVVF